MVFASGDLNPACIAHRPGVSLALILAHGDNKLECNGLSPREASHKKIVIKNGPWPIKDYDGLIEFD
jgi:hypothetical protein